MKIIYKMVKPMNVRSRLLSKNKKKQIKNINLKTLKLLIKSNFFNKINDFLCFDIIKYIFNRRNNEVLISYIIKINTFHQDVLHC